MVRVLLQQRVRIRSEIAKMKSAVEVFRQMQRNESDPNAANLLFQGQLRLCCTQQSIFNRWPTTAQCLFRSCTSSERNPPFELDIEDEYSIAHDLSRAIFQFRREGLLETVGPAGKVPFDFAWIPFWLSSIIGANAMATLYVVFSESLSNATTFNLTNTKGTVNGR